MYGNLGLRDFICNLPAWCSVISMGVSIRSTCSSSVGTEEDKSKSPTRLKNHASTRPWPFRPQVR